MKRTPSGRLIFSSLGGSARPLGARLAPLALGLGAAVLLLLLAPQLPAQAGGTVGTGPGTCTEAALDLALNGGGLVNFNCGPGPATITLSSQKVITLDTTIDGGGKITLSGGGSTRLFTVTSGVSLNLSGLTLSGGSALQGGAVYNAGRLTIAGSSLTGNNAPGGTGGALYSTGSLTLTASALAGNNAGGGLAGGIYNAGRLSILDSTVSGNSGGLVGGGLINDGTASAANTTFDGNSGDQSGAIDNNGTLTVAGGIFSNNTTSSGIAGGIYNSGSGRLTVTAGSFYSNTAAGSGGAIYNDGSLGLSGSSLSHTVAGNTTAGGGIYNGLLGVMSLDTSALSENSVPGGLGGGVYNGGRLKLSADTFAGNAAGGGEGGGLYVDISGTATIINSTFSANFGGVAGGAIDAAGALIVSSSTVYTNFNGGIVNGGSAAVVLHNTIVASNTVADCMGTVTSFGYNLDSDNTCGLGMTGDLPNTDPRLGALANNGGPTPTHALLAGSPAIDAGNPNGCRDALGALLPTDQRGVPRFGTCDIGAYEYVARLFLPLIRR